MVPMYANILLHITLDIRSTSGKCIFVYYLNTRKTTVCIISYINVLFLKEPSKKVCCELNFKCFIFSIFQLNITVKFCNCTACTKIQ
jgi:hypothetical protein